VTAMERPRTIHDFYGFPPELFAQRYPAPGSPELARKVAALVPGARLDTERGLDHGTWSVLKRMYPEADIPVVQLSLDRFRDPAKHYALGARLAPLRDEGVLVLGSGNIVHNLMLADPSAGPYGWATEFDRLVKERIESKDHESLVHYERLGEGARLAIPTNEHYLPMLYALALAGKGDSPAFFNSAITYGSMSMRSFIIGCR
jgi:4,5-DOPA dioxygenase extradiol